MYVFYLELLSVNTFIIDKCDVMKENGKKCTVMNNRDTREDGH